MGALLTSGRVRESWRLVKIGKQVGSTRKLVLAAGVSMIALGTGSTAYAECSPDAIGASSSITCDTSADNPDTEPLVVSGSNSTVTFNVNADLTSPTIGIDVYNLSGVISGTTITLNDGSDIVSALDGMLFTSVYGIDDNMVTLNGSGTISAAASYVGVRLYSTFGTVSNNTIALNDTSSISADFVSVWLRGFNTQDNTVTINGTAQSNNIGIAFTSTGFTSGNTLTLNDSGSIVAGGRAILFHGPRIENNTITLNGDVESYTGLYSVLLRSYGSGTLSNTLVIGSDASVTGNGGISFFGHDVHNNVVTINGNLTSYSNFGIRFFATRSDNNSLTLNSTGSIVSRGSCVGVFARYDNNIIIDGACSSTIGNGVYFLGIPTNNNNSLTVGPNGSIVAALNGVEMGHVSAPLTGSHSVTVEQGGVITAGVGYAAINGGSGSTTVVNGGTLNGGSPSVLLNAGDDSLMLTTGSVLNGLADGGVDTDALILTGTGTEDDDFINFESLTMSGTEWRLSNSVVLGGTGLTSVADGILYIDGSLTSSMITVDAGAGFGGTGSIIGDVDVFGDIVATTNDVAVTGNVTFNTGSSLLVGEVGGSSSYMMSVSGTATIDAGSAVAISGAPNVDFYSVVLTSSGLTGVFDNVTDAGGMTLANYSINTLGGTDVVVATLPVSEISAQAASAIGDNSFREFMGSVLARMDIAFKHPEGGDAGPAFAFNASRLKGLGRGSTSFTNTMSMRSIMPIPSVESFTSMMLSTGAEEVETIGDDIVLHADDEGMRAPAIWMRGFAGMTSQDASETLVGYDAHGGGISLGRDAYLGDNWLAGAAIGYARSKADLEGAAGEIDLDSFYAALYSSYENDGLRFNLIASGGLNDYDGRRMVTNGQEVAVASDEFDGWVWSLRAELARDYDVASNSILRPRFVIEHMQSNQGDYIDDGGALITELGVDEHTSKMMRYEGQVDWITSSMNGRNLPVEISLHAGVAHEDYSDDREVLAAFIGSSQAVALTLGEDARTLGLVGGAINYRLSDDMSFQAGYNGELGGEYQLHSIFAGFRLDW